jgi:hypothetical protein
MAVRLVMGRMINVSDLESYKPRLQAKAFTECAPDKTRGRRKTGGARTRQPRGIPAEEIHRT